MTIKYLVDFYRLSTHNYTFVGLKGWAVRNLFLITTSLPAWFREHVRSEIKCLSRQFFSSSSVCPALSSAVTRQYTNTRVVRLPSIYSCSLGTVRVSVSLSAVKHRLRQQRQLSRSRRLVSIRAKSKVGREGNWPPGARYKRHTFSTVFGCKNNYWWLFYWMCLKQINTNNEKLSGSAFQKLKFKK